MAENDRKPVRANFVTRHNKAIDACRKLKKTTDEKNAWMLRSYASNYYTKGTGKQHPLNMVDRAVSIWMPFLVGGLPKIIVEPKINLQLKPFAYTFQLALNNWLKRVKFAQRTLEPAVMNSLFGMGITKTGTQDADTRKLSGYLTVTGRPYSEIVDDHNYVFDITAKDREQYEFEGDEYILPTEKAKEMFKKHADQIKPDFKLYGDEHPKEITNPNEVRYDELRDYSAFIDLWIPKEQAIITIFPPIKGYTKILKTTEHKGPESGPYDTLGYSFISGSTIPIPPIFKLMQIDAAINTLFSKARNQAEQLKKIGAYEAGGEKDAETARKAQDGGMYGFTNVQNVKEITLGGVVPEIYEFLGFALAQYSEQAGVTGLDYRTRGKTLGQEQMLMSNATRTLDMMSQKVHAFASNIASKLAHEMWRNPTMQIAAVKKMAGIADITVLYNQLNQEGEFPTDYDIDVELYSMQRLSPEAKFQKMWQMLTGWVLPTATISAQQGKVLNVPEITKTLSNYMNLDTDSWYLSETPMETQLNPYQTTGGVKSADTRFGSNEGDNANNALQSQMSKVGTSTKEI